MNLVNVSFLKENPVIIDCRYDMTQPNLGRSLYEKDHLPGAYYVDLDQDMTSELSLHGGRHPLKNLESFTELIGSFGVDETSKVMIYDSGELHMASRLWFMLKLIGLKYVYILEGGYTALKDIEKTQVIPERKKSILTLNYQDQLLSNKDDIFKSMDEKKSIILDSRSAERYLGLEEPFDKIAGHIPTAVNYFWKDNFNGLKVKPLEELKERFKDLNSYDEIIVHCGSGITGCVNVMLLDEIGITSKLYLGSYSDWISYDDHEIIVKDQVRQKVKK